jgi:hypothetical protein
MAVVSKPNIGGTSRIQRPRGELEMTSIPSRAAETQNELLDPEMADVKGRLVEISADVEEEPPVHRQKCALPGID